MVIKKKVNGLIANFCLDGYLERDKYDKYAKRPSPKNLRVCVEALFIIPNQDIEKLRSNIFDNWKRRENVWNDTELVLFRHLLRCNGVSTLSELKKKTRLELHQVRDAVKGLEESETNKVPPLISIKWQGNKKLVFISPYFIKQILDQEWQN